MAFPLVAPSSEQYRVTTVDMSIAATTAENFPTIAPVYGRLIGAAVVTGGDPGANVAVTITNAAGDPLGSATITNGAALADVFEYDPSTTAWKTYSPASGNDAFVVKVPNTAANAIRACVILYWMSSQ